MIENIYDNELVSSTKSSTDNCSGRNVRNRSCVALPFKYFAREFRSILRRIPNDSFTMRRNRASSHGRVFKPLRLRRITALCTLGGGLN